LDSVGAGLKFSLGAHPIPIVVGQVEAQGGMGFGKLAVNLDGAIRSSLGLRKNVRWSSVAIVMSAR